MGMERRERVKKAEGGEGRWGIRNDEQGGKK